MTVTDYPTFPPAMRPREFDKTINACRTPARKGRPRALDPAKLAALDATTRARLTVFVVGDRAPVLAALLPTDAPDWAAWRRWLAAMGYLYTTTTANGTFLHTGEHRIR